MNKLTKEDFERFCKAHVCGGYCDSCDPRPLCPLRSQNYGDNPTCGGTIVFSPADTPYLRATAENINEIAHTYNVISEWIKTHPEEPKKTRQSEFLKHCPKASLDDGVLRVCPEEVDETFKYCDNYGRCSECLKDYWLTEIE